MKAKIGEVDPNKAWEMMQNSTGAVLIDVRTTIEYHYVGHPVGAVHIPWQEPPAWQPDPNFVEKVSEKLHTECGKDAAELHDTPVLLICRSGSRSADAAAVLSAAGFNRAYNVLEGFEGGLDDRQHRSTMSGWRFHNLPWKQD